MILSIPNIHIFTACVQGAVLEFLTKGQEGYFIEDRMVGDENVQWFTFIEYNYVGVTTAWWLMMSAVLIRGT